MDVVDGAPLPVRLGPPDLDVLLRLHDRLHGSLPEPALFARETPAFFAQCLGAEGQVFGIRRAGGLIAYGVLGLPIGSDYNFGAWAGLPSSRHGEVAHLDGAGVDPPFRGLGLQRALIACRLEQARAAGRSLVFSTAAPRNRASLANLLGSGFVIVALQALFGGHDRYILLHAPTAGLHACTTAAAADLVAQRRLLASGLVGLGPSGAGPGAPIGFAAAPQIRRLWS